MLKVLLLFCEIQTIHCLFFALLFFLIYDIVIMYHFQTKIRQHYFKCTDVSLLSTMLVRFIFSFYLFHHELGLRYNFYCPCLCFDIFTKTSKFLSVLPLMLAETSVTKWSDLNHLTMVAISLYVTNKASLWKPLYLPLWSRLSFLGQATEKINSPTFFYLNLCMCWNLCVCYLMQSAKH